MSVTDTDRDESRSVARYAADSHWTDFDLAELPEIEPHPVSLFKLRDNPWLANIIDTEPPF